MAFHLLVIRARLMDCPFKAPVRLTVRAPFAPLRTQWHGATTGRTLLLAQPVGSLAESGILASWLLAARIPERINGDRLGHLEFRQFGWRLPESALSQWRVRHSRHEGGGH